MEKIENLLLSENDIALATDLYELTMAAAYFKSRQTDRIGIFEAFVRDLDIIVPEDGVDAFTESDHVSGLDYMKRVYGAKIKKVSDVVKSF